MQRKRTKNLAGIWLDLKSYLGTRFEYVQLKAIEKVSKIMADILSTAMLIFLILMSFLAASVTLAFYLSGLLGSYTLGFGTAALFFILVACLVVWTKDRLERKIGSSVVKRYFERHCEDDEEIADDPNQDCHKVVKENG